MAKFCSKISFLILNSPRRFPVVHFSQAASSYFKVPNPQTFSNPLRNLVNFRLYTTILQENREITSSLQLKKRVLRKKQRLSAEEESERPPGLFSITAYATAEEYDLEKLTNGLKELNLYEPRKIDNSLDVLHAIAKYEVDNEPRELFFFREGAVVMWNVTDLEASNVLNFLRSYQFDSHSEGMVQEEAETMSYSHQNGHSALTNGNLSIGTSKTNLTLEKYTFSNAMSLSVKLAIWEASLEKYIDSIESVTEDLKKGNKIKMSQEDALRKHGELFALRHLINLSSDLLDTPDFYWDNEHLESFYLQVCSYFSIAKRTKVRRFKVIVAFAH